MVSSFPMKKNTATKIVFPILDADGDLVGGATALDSEYSIDGGNFADCTNEATNITSAAVNTGIYYLDLVAAETNGDVICIQVKTSTADAKTTVLVFYTATQTLDETDAIADAIKAKTDLIPADIVTQLDTNIPAIKAKTDNLPTDPADESLLEAEINANETKIDALQTDVTAIKDYVDTEVAAILAAVVTEVADIKAITDTLTLTAIADAVHDEVTEGTTTLRQAIKLISSALFAKSSGGGTATLIFQDLADSKPRITATCDANGNRTDVTVDGT